MNLQNKNLEKMAAPIFSLIELGKYKLAFKEANTQLGSSGKFVPNINYSLDLASGKEKEWINFNRKSVQVTNEKTKIDANVLTLKVGNQTDRFKPLTDSSLRWEIVYDADPTPKGKKTYTEKWEIKGSPGLTFNYQGTLEESYQRGNFGYATFEEFSQHVKKPENVVGSYAIYGRFSSRVLNADGSIKYHGGCGKRGHIYRPKLIDAELTERWATLEIDYDPITNTGEMRVVCDFKDLVFPVTLDPDQDIGYTSIGLLTWETNNIMRGNWKDASAALYQSTANADKLKSVSIYTSGPGGNAQIAGAVYNDDPADSNKPEDVEDETGYAGSILDPGWTEISLGEDVVINGSDYYFPAFRITNYNNITIYYDEVTNGWIFDSSGGASFPNPWVGDVTQGYQFSVFFTHTVSGGQSHALKGAFAGQGALAGALILQRSCAGAITATSALSARLICMRVLSGVIAGMSAVSGRLRALLSLAGTVAATTSVTGGLRALRSLAGNIAAASSLSARLICTRALSGAIAATSAVTGALSLIGKILLAGTIAATSAVSGRLRAMRALAGAVAATSSVTSGLRAIRSLAGAITAISSLTGRLAQSIVIAALRRIFTKDTLRREFTQDTKRREFIKDTERRTFNVK